MLKTEASGSMGVLPVYDKYPEYCDRRALCICSLLLSLRLLRTFAQYLNHDLQS